MQAKRARLRRQTAALCFDRMRDLSRFDRATHEEDRLELEVSTECFDRVAFAQRALDVVRPARMTIAVCEGVYRIRVAAGRAWGKGEGERWAIVSVPPTASRRAIVLALTELAGRPGDPYVLDVLLAEGSPTPYRSQFA
jgi:hypothetical protein